MMSEMKEMMAGLKQDMDELVAKVGTLEVKKPGDDNVHNVYNHDIFGQSRLLPSDGYDSLGQCVANDSSEISVGLARPVVPPLKMPGKSVFVPRLNIPGKSVVVPQGGTPSGCMSKWAFQQIFLKSYWKDDTRCRIFVGETKTTKRPKRGSIGL